MMRHPDTQIVLFFFWIILLGNQPAGARILHANPDNYRQFLPGLAPGDTLFFADGVYKSGLNVYDLAGTRESPIVISGPMSGSPAVFEGRSCCNTVSIKKSSFVIIQNIVINGKNIPNIDAVKAEGTSGNWAHDITLQYLRIVGHGANQQTVGISTKCAAWNWIIRRNVIDGAGTGMYLGNSDGNKPFVNGLIEYNLVMNTVGYNMQIKHQNEGLRTVPGMPQEGKTIIRYNVFSKDKNASSGGDARPNVLVGNFPAFGPGMNDVYEIYGNFFYNNPHEALFQGTGNIALYSNIFVNFREGWGVSIMRHNGFAPRDVTVFNNSVFVTNGKGITFYKPDLSYRQVVVGNAVFAPVPIANAPVSEQNITGTFDEAGNFVTNLTADLDSLDVFPLPGALEGEAIDRTRFESFTDYDRDFNGTARQWRFRGAYSGAGANPGWRLALEIRPPVRDIIQSVKPLVPGPGAGFTLHLFPNPARETVTLVIDAVSGSRARFSIVDAAGRVVEKITAVRPNARGRVRHYLSTRRYQPGVYFIVAETEKQMATGTVLIVR